MLTWQQVQDDEISREGLYLMSGMAFITAPPMKIAYQDFNVTRAYVGFNNGLLYMFPDLYF